MTAFLILPFMNYENKSYTRSIVSDSYKELFALILFTPQGHNSDT